MPKSGKQLWSVNVAAEILTAPTVSPKMVLVRGVNGKLHSLSMADGHELWQVQQTVPKLSLRGTASAAIAGDVAVTGFDNGRVVATSLVDGSSVWETQLQIPTGKTDIDRLADVVSRAQIDGNDVYVVGFQGKVCHDGAGLRADLWSHDTSSYRGIAIDDSNVYVSTAAGEVMAVNRHTGVEAWRQKALTNRGYLGPGGRRRGDRGCRLPGLPALAEQEQRRADRSRARGQATLYQCAGVCRWPAAGDQ